MDVTLPPPSFPLLPGVVPMFIIRRILVAGIPRLQLSRLSWPDLHRSIKTAEETKTSFLLESAAAKGGPAAVFIWRMIYARRDLSFAWRVARSHR
ncbi:hypothetical protein CDAR_371751 [Caerostris darwini]|uniref:ATP synthase F0 subunit 8 n=1 Tax=Caerostris darwini TaxID=1538125 RepID=A0AAV4TB06_9ARAC|nr:hypothetical protein CDAR_371751 [Caerostris darwini]